jgi:hypothetical protein
MVTKENIPLMPTTQTKKYQDWIKLLEDNIKPYGQLNPWKI